MFCPFTSLKPPKKQNFEKMNKIAGDIILLMCIKNNNHLMYSSWHTKWHRHSFLSFWAIFCNFTPLANWKIKFWKNEKCTNRCHHCTHIYQKLWSYDVCFLRLIWSATDRTFCYFRPFFALLPPKNPKNQNFEKTKKYLEILSIYTCVP